MDRNSMDVDNSKGDNNSVCNNMDVGNSNDLLGTDRNTDTLLYSGDDGVRSSRKAHLRRHYCQPLPLACMA